jgi:hypothetical protein
MTRFERVLAGLFIAARAGNGGGLVIFVVLLPFLAAGYLAVFLGKALLGLAQKQKAVR